MWYPYGIYNSIFVRVSAGRPRFSWELCSERMEDSVRQWKEPGACQVKRRSGQSRERYLFLFYINIFNNFALSCELREELRGVFTKLNLISVRPMMRSGKIHLKARQGCQQGDHVWDGGGSSQSGFRLRSLCHGAARHEQVWWQEASCTHLEGRACVGSVFRRLQRKNRGAGMDLAGFWMLALFEYFFTELGVCTRWKKKMFFLFLFSPWPHGPLLGTRLQANWLHLNFSKMHSESQYQI